MNLRRWLLSLVMIVLLVAAPVSAKTFTYLTTTIEEIAASLPDKPIAVGFDVDDTVLFSSPGFYYAFSNTDGPDGKNKYGERPLSSDQFWKDQSCDFDRFSMPKESARAVIDMHNKRGDTIYFVTARPAVKGEILTRLLHREFKLKNQPDAIFSGKTSKAVFIRKNKISIFYGDSDSDISEAYDAGIRAIRFLRSPISTNKGKYNPGMHGEVVLRDSEN